MVIASNERYKMKKLVHQNRIFEHFPDARYATDVCFQQICKRGRTIQEAKSWYSGKHKLHGYKFECSVLPIGPAINRSAHYRGGTSDLIIMQRQQVFHKNLSKEKANKMNITDDGDFKHTFNIFWGVLVDKVYQDVQEILREIYRTRKFQGSILSALEERFNKKVVSDRIILKTFLDV